MQEFKTKPDSAPFFREDSHQHLEVEVASSHTSWPYLARRPAVRAAACSLPGVV